MKYRIEPAATAKVDIRVQAAMVTRSRHPSRR